MSKKCKNRILRWFTLYIPLTIFLIWFLFPLYWMIITSIKSKLEMAKLTSPLFVDQPTLIHYKELIFDTNFLIWMRNSAIVSVVATIASLIISCMAAYAIARMRFFGRKLVSRGVLFSYLIPRVILFLPLYTLVNRFRMVDTLWGLIITYLTFMIPFCTWLLIGYFKSIPIELEECARIDGAGRLRILKDIIFPIAAPGVITAALFSFTLSWNEFLYPLVFNTLSQKQVIPVSISYLITGDLFEWGKIMATGVLYTLPLVAVYYPLQGSIEEGMTAGAVKG